MPPATSSPGGKLRRHWRAIGFASLLVVYVVYTVFVIKRSDIGLLDRWIYTIHFKRDILSSWQYTAIYDYVTLGQRGPATLVFLPYFIWTAWRMRSPRPLIMLLVALVLLNLSVGVVKLTTGRLGPRETVHYFDVMLGGDIYPSGHVSNAVVLYGLIAMISLRHRRLFGWVAVWIAFSVGIGTVMINTHWFSDIVGGWMAGGLVLLALPWFVPAPERLVLRVYRSHVKSHTDPLVARATRRWPRLAHTDTATSAEQHLSSVD